MFRDNNLVVWNIFVHFLKEVTSEDFIEHSMYQKIISYKVAVFAILWVLV